VDSFTHPAGNAAIAAIDSVRMAGVTVAGMTNSPTG